MNRHIIAGSLLTLGACTSSSDTLPFERQQLHFSAAVDMVAYDASEPVAIDDRVPCDFELLTGDLVVRKVLADDEDYTAVIVQDSQTGVIPEYGLIQCFEDENGTRIVRGNDGW